MQRQVGKIYIEDPVTGEMWHRPEWIREKYSNPESPYFGDRAAIAKALTEIQGKPIHYQNIYGYTADIDLGHRRGSRAIYIKDPDTGEEWKRSEWIKEKYSNPASEYFGNRSAIARALTEIQGRLVNYQAVYRETSLAKLGRAPDMSDGLEFSFDSDPQTKLPNQMGPIHFVGIGGIGMSGIAEALLNQGYTVQGSDVSSTKLTQRLAGLGARVFLGQAAENVRNADVVVVSSAIQPQNEELNEARRFGLPVVRRAEMLAELMRLKSNIAVAGTHGKTTTTTLIATLLDRGGFDPTVINGGIIRAYESNARLGGGEWMVVEADESDGTFVKLPATVAVVTNIDPEHLDHYGDFDSLRNAFDQFVSNVPFYGYAVCCIDHPEVQALVGRVTDRRIVTYGLNPQADVCAVDLMFKNGAAHFGILLRSENSSIPNCSLPMPGEHNVSNALAAVAVARKLGMGKGEIREALAAFAGVNRRFTFVGEVDGVKIIDDYAHHPVEISAVLGAARQSTDGRIIAIHQPHRYSRLASLFEDFCTCFNDADRVAITEIYAAGESPVAGIGREALVEALIRHGHRGAEAIEGQEGMAEYIRREAQPGDMVVCLGAGSISAWANMLPEILGTEQDQ